MSDPRSPLENIFTRSIIWEIFRDAADEDYLIARKSAEIGLQYQFSWSAQQALEKYLKAILLLNGISVKGYGHKLTKMFEIATEVGGDLIALVHCPPNPIENLLPPRGFSKFEPYDRFIERVERAGNPNNRYRSFSMSFDWYDLHKLDEIVFLLRRVAFPLSIKMSTTSISAREYLRKNRELQLHPKMGFENIITKPHLEEINRTFRQRNFAFFYDEALEFGEFRRGRPAHNSSLYRAIEDLHHQGDSLEWLIEMNAFPKSLTGEIGKIISSRKSR